MYEVHEPLQLRFLTLVKRLFLKPHSKRNTRAMFWDLCAIPSDVGKRANLTTSAPDLNIHFRIYGAGQIQNVCQS